MIHIGLQVQNKEQLKLLEKKCQEIGILSFVDFEKNKAGIYYMNMLNSVEKGK